MLEKEDTDSDHEWKIEVGESYCQEEELKEGKNYQLNKMTRLVSLKRSGEFSKVFKEKKLNTNYFTIYFSKQSENNKKKSLNISFVMKKKIGNAIKRNRIKRKLKAAVIKCQKNINFDYTYVVLGKTNAYKEKFISISEEMSNSFKKINKK